MADALARALPPAALTLASACSMAVEIVAGRALAPYVGMSLYSWTIIIAVVLAGLSFGHWVGGIVADRAARPARAVGLTLLVAAATTALSLPLLRLAAPMAEGMGPVGHAGALALAAFLAPSLAAGIVSPVLTRMAMEAEPPARQGRALGLMFALGAAGAILGTLAAGLVLVSWIGTSASLLLLAAIYGVSALPFLGMRGGAGAAVALGLLLGLGGFGPGRALLASPCLEESEYFCIRIDETALFGRPARIMALDHLAHGVNDAADPAWLPSPYLHGVDEIVKRRLPAPEIDALFLGGGAYTLPRAWGATKPGARLIVAEIDPEVTRLAAERMGFLPESAELIHADARLALRRLPPERRFDVIFADAFHDVTIPAHLTTDEFHAEVAARLKPGGLYIANVIDAKREPRFMLSLARTLQARFAHVELWLDAAELGPGEARTTWIVLASDRATGVDEVNSTYGLPRTWLRAPTEAMLAVLPAGETAFLTDDYAPVDRLLSRLLTDPALAER